MPTSIEAQGLTVDEAIQLALNQLGVGRDRVEIEIVHHPRSGFLGIGARRARVRATLRERVMDDGEEFDMAGGERRSRGRRRRRAPRRRGGERQRSDSAEGEDKQGRRDTQASGEKTQARDERRGRGQRNQEGRNQQSSRGRERGQRGQDGGSQQSSRGRERAQRGQDADNQQSSRGQRGQAAGNQPSSRRGDSPQQQPSRRGGRGRRQSGRTPRDTGEQSAVAAPPAQPEAQPAPSQDQPTQQAQTVARTMTADEVRSRAESVVADMMKLMGIGAEINTTLGPVDGEITVNVRAEAEGLLIGRRGQTLDAVEHVVNRMVVPHDVVSEVRVSIDVGGYRDRRRESLVALAERLKARAVQERRRVQVSPMNARDRAIFEGALAGDDVVETRVLGSGVYRRLLLVPAGADDESVSEETMASQDTLSAGGTDDQESTAEQSNETLSSWSPVQAADEQASEEKPAGATAPGGGEGGGEAALQAPPESQESESLPESIAELPPKDGD